MPKSEDIQTLYRRFGGDASSYKEIGSTDQAAAAEQNWPMLGQLKTRTTGEAPPAHRAVLVGGERREQVEVVIYKNAPQDAPQPASQVVPPAAPQPEPQAAPLLHQIIAPAPAPVIARVEPKPEKTVKRPRRAVAPAPVAAPPVAAPPPPARKKRTAGSATSQVGLKGVFDRMVPSDPAPAPAASSRGLKRSVKW